MAMDFWFHIYARKSQNYPGFGLRFENNFLLIIGIISKKFYLWFDGGATNETHKKQIKNSNQKFKKGQTS